MGFSFLHRAPRFICVLIGLLISPSAHPSWATGLVGAFGAESGFRDVLHEGEGTAPGQQKPGVVLPLPGEHQQAIAQSQPSTLPAGQTAADDRDDLERIEVFQGLITEGKFQEVEPLLQSYLTDHPKSWKAQYFLGYVQFRQRRLADSMNTLAKSLVLNVNNAEAHKILGRVLSIIGRYDLAQKEFEIALRLNPGSAELYYNLGRMHAAQDDFHKARRDLEKAVQLDPMYLEAYNALGFALEALGEDDAARECFQNAIRINEQRLGKFDAPYVNLSGYYNRHGNLDLALVYAKKALGLNPKSDLAYSQMARAYRSMQDWGNVAEALEKAIEIKPTSSQYYYVLATAYRKLGKMKESQEAIEKFKSLERESATLLKERAEARRGSSSLLDRKPIEE